MTSFQLNRCVFGPALRELRKIPDDTFHCVVTSPPYWGLRDYNVPGQYGLEGTPQLYVRRLVALFREVRRVLRADGTAWINLGDSYAGAPGGGQGKNGQRASRTFTARIALNKAGVGLKPKDLAGIPWRVAFGLQDDGWWLRSEIIWAKPNPMPESILDRPTKAHEQIFLLSKSRRYHYDGKAIAEQVVGGSVGSVDSQRRAERAIARTGGAISGGTARSTLGQERPDRNARDVWTFPTEPFDGAHFAVMPSAMAKRCILAGCPEGGAVLDPFFGSGTIGEVAEALGRRWFGIEINRAYEPLIRKRTAQTGLIFNEATVGVCNA